MDLTSPSADINYFALILSFTELFRAACSQSEKTGIPFSRVVLARFAWGLIYLVMLIPKAAQDRSNLNNAYAASCWSSLIPRIRKMKDSHRQGSIPDKAWATIRIT